MKKFLILFFSLISILFFSCSNNDVDSFSQIESDTLKNFLYEKGEDTLWTKELEADMLSYNLKDETFFIGSNVELNSEVYNLFSQKKYPAFPELYDFGSLDSRDLSSSLKNKIEEFLSSVSKNPYSEKDTYFEERYIFNYVFFLNNLKDNWKQKTSLDFPTKDDYKNIQNSSNGETVEKKINSEDEKNNLIIPEELFKRWIYGKPFNNSEIIQIPVRIYTNKVYFDINIYLKNKEDYPIYNICLTNWSL